MKSIIRLLLAMAFVAILPASAFADQNAYNFGWTVTGSEAAKPFQVFDDGQYIYVQFDDPVHVPAILAETPAGTALLGYQRSYPYIVIKYPTNLLIFRVGPYEARALRLYADGKPQAVTSGSAAPVKTGHTAAPMAKPMPSAVRTPPQTAASLPPPATSVQASVDVPSAPVRSAKVSAYVGQ